MRDDVKTKVSELLKHTKAQAKSIPTSEKKSISQKITGDGNTQVIGNIIYNTVKPPSIKILPSAESIGGGNTYFKNRIEELFKKIGQAREKRYGETAYSAMYRHFKNVFKIPQEAKWTIIWSWPKACAPAIIHYLEGKYSHTIQGKIEKAASKEGYLHTRQHLYRIEKELLDNIGLTMQSPEVRDFLNSYFGVTSHTKLTHIQHWHLVCHLETYVKEIIGE